MPKEPESIDSTNPRILLLGIFSPENNLESIDDYFDEFFSLIDTLGLENTYAHCIKLRSIDKSHFLTKGKLEELVKICEEQQIDQVICSEVLTPVQERNLENMLHCVVFDREQLILEIFKKSATTAEGKIQVEMAHVEYLKTRMAGKGKEFAQQEGHIGARGPGEAVKEKLKRFFATRQRQAKKRLDVLQKSRDTQRKRRLESTIPLVCLVGYTNAGKSTILNILTKSDVLVEDKLFATLDTTTRELYYQPDKKLLISDTVGFISQLPHHLIEAFKSTLDELHYANLLLHVIDSSNSAWKDHIHVVNKTLKELNVHAPLLHVFNKSDKLNELECALMSAQAEEYQPYVIVNAMSKEGIAPIIEYFRTYRFGQPTKTCTHNEVCSKK